MTSVPGPTANGTTEPPVVVVRSLTRARGVDAGRRNVVEDVSFDIAPGRFVAIMGPSGSGKSTLLHMIGGLDTPTSGTVTVDGRDVAALGDGGKANLRRHTIGFVFQAFNLVPVLTAEENVALPALIAGVPRRDAHERAGALLERVGLGGRGGQRPSQLSGGEQQRVALARAIVMRPKVILADEPTGALDSASALRVIELLGELRREDGQTVVLVTHDVAVASAADDVLLLRDGRLVGRLDVAATSNGGDRPARTDAVAAWVASGGTSTGRRPLHARTGR